MITKLAQRASVRIQLQLAQDLPLLPTTVETALYRIAQEALSNSLQHAQATQTTVQLHVQHDTVQLRISDDGCGMKLRELDTPMPDLNPSQKRQRGLGLWNMRERALEAVDKFF